MTIQDIIHYLERISGADTVTVQVFAVVFATLLLDFILKRILKRVAVKLKATSNRWDDVLIQSVRQPITALIWLLGISYAAHLAEWKFMDQVQRVGVIIVVAWTLIRLVSNVEKRILADHELAGDKIDKTTADAITQLLRITIIITSLLVGMQTLGFNISAVLAFGGIGGVAVGFAAKDLLANFFGALMLYLDRPFAVGDWIRSPDRDIEGTVEKIGWRLTTIRTFDKRPLYIPNAIFASISVQNPSRMSHRRINETIGVRYDDVNALPAIVADIEAMLKAHPEIDAEQTLMVNFNTFGPSSLDFFIYAFTRTTNWQEFHRVKQDVLFRISGIINGHGAEIAFPTSTVHVASMVGNNTR